MTRYRILIYNDKIMYDLDMIWWDTNDPNFIQFENNDYSDTDFMKPNNLKDKSGERK